MFLFGFCSSRACGGGSKDETPLIDKIENSLDPNSSKKIIKKLRKASRVLLGFKTFEESLGIGEEDVQKVN